MNNQTLDKLRQMRLFGMYEAFRTNLEGSIKETLTPDQFIAMLVNSEWDDRKNKSISRLIKLANFRYKASLEQLDYSVERGLEKNEVHRLASLDFIKEHKDLFITGSTGTGKLSGISIGLSCLPDGIQGTICFYVQVDGTA